VLPFVRKPESKHVRHDISIKFQLLVATLPPLKQGIQLNALICSNND